MEINNKLDKYIKLTESALKKVKEKKIKSRKALELLKLAECYYSDALHFKKKGDLVNAFAAINYAHAFLDAGVVLGLFKVKDNKLFMSD